MSVTLPPAIADILPILQALPYAEKLKLIHALSDEPVSQEITADTVSDNLAWQAGQGLFGSYNSGRSDISQNAKALAKKRIREKHGKNTA